MKNFKKVLALVLVVATLLSFATIASAATSKDFEDKDKIATDYTAAIDVLTYIKVLDGYPDKTFRPEGEITRAEAAKIIAQLDNGSTDIDKLYTSANPFTDCKGHWAESFIAYCYKTGIIDGIGNLKFAPNDKVTGIQFLKMALIVLGFDAKKEGLTGASWAVNTLALAKKAGLLKGLAKTFKVEVNLTRQEAAQIMLNALNSNIVDYGYEYKPLGSTLNNAQYVTTAGAVVVAGTHLYDAWNLGKEGWDDCFMRPGYMWTYWVAGKTLTVAKYKDTPVAKHQTAITGCDILVDAGVPKTDLTDKIYLEVYRNGVNKTSDYSDDYLVWNPENHNYDQTVITLNHTTAHDCAATEYVFGAQGTQAELYYMGYFGGVPVYRLVLIDTWLGQVSGVSKTNIDKDGHIVTGNGITIDVWYDEAVIDGTADIDLLPSRSNRTENRENVGGPAWTAAVTGFAKGDMVLVTKSWKDGCGVVDVNAAIAKDGILTGYTNVTKAGKPTQTEVDTVETADAAKFVLGYNSSKDINNTQKAYVASGAFTFYYDLFGNVIGMTGRKAAAKQYMVVDSVWAEHIKNYPVTGDLVKMDASSVKDAPIAKLLDRDNKDYVEWAQELSVIPTENTDRYDHLFLYTTDADGNYYLTKPVSTVWMTADGAKSFIVKGDPNIYDLADAEGAEAVVRAHLNEDTQFLFRTGLHTYVSYSGFENVPTLSAQYMEWIDDNNDGYADVVYGYVAKLDGTSDICFTFDTTTRYTKTIKGTRYDVWSVYIDGELTTIYTTTDKEEEEDGSSKQFTATGLYNLDYETVDGVVVAKVTPLTDTGTNKVVVKNIESCDKNSLIFAGEWSKAVNVTGIPVYLVDTNHNEIDAGETADLDGAKNVWVQYYGTKIVAFYVPYGG